MLVVSIWKYATKIGMGKRDVLEENPLNIVQLKGHSYIYIFTIRNTIPMCLKEYE